MVRDRGGAFGDKEAATCGASWAVGFDFMAAGIGFRCCSGP
jgi:hypothetical protein